jgi:hypothetical protein
MTKRVKQRILKVSRCRIQILVIQRIHQEQKKRKKMILSLRIKNMLKKTKGRKNSNQKVNQSQTVINLIKIVMIRHQIQEIKRVKRKEKQQILKGKVWIKRVIIKTEIKMGV